MIKPWYKSKIAIGGYVVLFLLLIISLDGPNNTSQRSLTVKQDRPRSSQVNGADTSLNNPPETNKKSTGQTYYTVLKVVDGDTISVSIDGKLETLRLIGLNTPETVNPRKPVECFGKEASNKAKSLLEGQNILLEADLSQGERDKYNRLLRYVFLQNGTLFNKLMIQDGYAYEYTYNTPYKYQAEFKQAEREAMIAKKGLWADNACPETSTEVPLIPNTTPQPSNSPNQYICSYNAYNCSNFASQNEAQTTFEACGGTSNDIHELDRDGDGRVCESLK